MAYESVSERSGWEERRSEMPIGLGEEAMRLAFQSTSRGAWADWLRTPLLGAVAQGNVSSATALLKAGASSVLEQEPGSPAHRTMMHAAAEGGSAEIARALLAHSADHDAGAGAQTTPLHVAAERGHAAVARVLLRAGAETDGDWPMAPLHLACRGGHHELAADLLMNGARVNALTFFHSTALCLAASKGHIETTRVLMRASADPEYRVAVDCRTALAAAATSGHGHVVRQLVADGAEVNARSLGWTALHLVSTKCHISLEVVRTLIGLGADVNAAGPERTAPLHAAARSNHALEIKALAEAGADIEGRNVREETPLHVACRCLSHGAVNALLQLGADTAATDKNNRTPRDAVSTLNAAAEASTVYRLLDRAPAIRAWHHRGWIVMLRARRLRARRAAVVGAVGEGARASPTTGTGQGETAGREGRGQRPDGEADGRRKKKSGRGKEGGGPVAAAVAAERPPSALAGAVSLLLGVQDDQLFRNMVLFL